MRLRKKILYLAALTFAFLVMSTVGLYFYSMAKVKNGLSYFHGRIVEGEGYVESLDISYDKLGVKLPFGLEAKDLQLDIMTTGTDQRVQLTAGEVNCQLKGVPTGTMNVLARNVGMASGAANKPLLSNQYRIRNIEVDFVEYESYVSLLNPDQSMRRIYNHLSEILSRGDTLGRLRLQGTVYFDFGGETVLPQRFTTRKNGDLTRIVLNRKDLNFVAPKFASRLSEGDLELVAEHPLRAPRLLEIRHETEEKSKELRWAHKDFPEDVYRHVLWSYLLTKEYGPEFAQIVTNAHETGSYNTEEEMARDRQNNRVGIAYAMENIPEAKLLERVHADPRVQF